mgnify:CR=1 FL=1
MSYPYPLSYLTTDVFACAALRHARQVDSFMGRDTGLKNEEAVVAALKKSKFLANMTDPEFKELLKACEQTDYNPGEVRAALGLDAFTRCLDELQAEREMVLICTSVVRRR